MFDTSTLTLGQLEDFETASGMELGDVLDSLTNVTEDTMPPARVLTAAALLASILSGDPLTRDEARALSLDDALALMGQLTDTEDGEPSPEAPTLAPTA